MWSDDQIQSDIYDMIADGLCVERDEIRPEARFMTDLGGESIELLELSFRCGRHFGVDPQFQKLLPASELAVDPSNRLTPESIEKIRQRAPFLDLSSFERDPHVDHLSDLITVGAICDCMNQLIRERQRSALPGMA